MVTKVLLELPETFPNTNDETASVKPNVIITKPSTHSETVVRIQ